MIFSFESEIISCRLFASMAQSIKLAEHYQSETHFVYDDRGQRVNYVRLCNWKFTTNAHTSLKLSRPQKLASKRILEDLNHKLSFLAIVNYLFVRN